MKRTLQAATVAVLVFGVFTTPRIRAEDEAKSSSSEEHRSRWAKKLGLSEEQSAKLKEAFKAHREAAKPLRAELKEALSKLREQIDDSAGDKELQVSVDHVQKARAAVRTESETFRSKAASLLPARQRAKLALHAAERDGEGSRWKRSGRNHGGSCGGRGGWKEHRRRGGRDYEDL